MARVARREFMAGASALGLAGLAPATAAPANGPAAANALYERIFQAMLVAAPQQATSLGLDGDGLNRRLDEVGPGGKLNLYAPFAAALPELRKLPRGSLTGRDRAWLDTAIWYGERARETAARPYGGISGYGYPVPYLLAQLSGPYLTVPAMLDGQHAVADAAGAEAYLARLAALPAAIDANLATARDSAARGAVPPPDALARAIAQTRTMRAERGTASGMVEPLVRKARAAGVPGDWGARGAAIVDGPIAAALDRQLALLESWPRDAAKAPGAVRLPDGPAYYADALRFHTSTNLSAADIHRIGLEQVAALEAEAEPLLRAQGMTQGSVGARMTALGKDPKHLFPDTDPGRAELIDYIRAMLGKQRARMPELFHQQPAGPMEVRRVPAASEAGAPFAYAEAGSLDGTRPGLYYINLASTASAPRWTLPTLSAHEGIAGHLWHGAIVNAEPSIPRLFRATGLPAFGEGWGLYAETLHDELGLYADDPLGRIGMIQSFLFRAARLVVDTGMHAQGWSRERAVRYFVGTVGWEPAAAAREIDRYLVWPGQACSYKIGHNEILRIRAATRRRLGPRFDLKSFHELVLLGGSVPLEVLAAAAATWDGGRTV